VQIAKQQPMIQYIKLLFLHPYLLTLLLMATTIKLLATIFLKQCYRIGFLQWNNDGIDSLQKEKANIEVIFLIAKAVKNP
jgi:hypothetical protein